MQCFLIEYHSQYSYLEIEKYNFLYYTIELYKMISSAIYRNVYICRFLLTRDFKQFVL